MTDSSRPKKDPESVRRRLLTSTASLMATQGFAGVSISEIASDAGVTKGGLFHHFPSKRDLISAVFDDELEQLSLLIEDFLARDPCTYGCFTRAYIRATFIACTDKAYALTFSLCAEPELVSRWEKWLNQRLEQHRDTDSEPALEIARLAADGIWFTSLLKGGQPENTESLLTLQHRLLALTLKNITPDTSDL
ncbi:TetR/AcrR family transcriptional regulator [Pectobacterium versatile]|uniref:TetR/AcrR family transcriptional regulator n=1 Tax=Pectobacterium versatile TaxID=2488639 RepID=UPI0020BDEAD6|nr:TetR/AcrR family transcriptional regulator [Pectobacterium versatile]